LLLTAATACAGMAAPLPDHDTTQRVLRLNQPPLARLQALSFFVLVLLCCALAVQFLLNRLARGFQQPPRASFCQAPGGVILWGLLLVSVLAMIAGARELMTPGAWEKQGFTYRLTPGPPGPDPDLLTTRRQHLERLRQALWHFAALHNGHFPSAGQ